MQSSMERPTRDNSLTLRVIQKIGSGHQDIISPESIQYSRDLSVAPGRFADRAGSGINAVFLT